MKIAFLCSSQSWGGLELNFVRLAGWLKAQNDIILYAIKDSKIDEFAIQNQIPIQYIPQHYKYYDFVRAYQLYQRFKRDNIQLIFFGHNRDMSIAASIKTLSFNKIKVVYQQQMQIGVDKKDWTHTLRFSKIDAWITPLPYLAEEIKVKTKFNPDQVHIIPLCIDIETFQAKIYSKTQARERLSLPQSAFLLGIMGRIDKHKGQAFLIEALHRLRTRNYEVELLIVGEPTYAEGDNYLNQLKESIDNYQLAEYVYFRPFTYDVNQFYNAIDIFTLASKGETFGMVTLEAMINGLPIIGTNSAGTPEILKHGQVGLLYEPENLDEFIERVISLIQNPDQRKQLGEQAQQEALKNYSHRVECQQIQNLLKSLL